MLRSSLILCRTPLQARICLRLVEIGDLEQPDVLYLTQDDSEVDRNYFAQLRAVGGICQYLYIPRQRIDILNHLKAAARVLPALRRSRYATLYLGSLNSPLFRWFLRRNRRAVLVTFDDGTANIFPESLYRAKRDPGRMRLYAAMVRLPTCEEVRARAVRHYTIYRGFPNVVNDARIRVIDVFPPAGRETSVAAGRMQTYFIGQPFREYMSDAMLATLKRFVATQQLDYYVPHPREMTPLIEGVPVLDKGGELAEVAIMNSSGPRRPRLLSAFSTVLFNVSEESAEKVYLHLSGLPGAEARVDLMRRAGCQIVVVDKMAQEPVGGRCPQ